MGEVALKDPSATLDWTFDLTADGYLEDEETIDQEPVWSVSPDGLTVGTTAYTMTSATAFFSGGTAGSVYRATVQFHTSMNRTDERTIVIRVEHQ